MQAMRNARWIARQSARRPFAPHARSLSAVPEKPARGEAPPPFVYRDLFEQTEPVDVPYRKLEGSEAWVSEVAGPLGRSYVHVAPEALTALTKAAMTDVAHLLRPGHLRSSRSSATPAASSNDRFVALELLKNANVAAGMVLPGCQDTGTGIVMGKRGALVLTDGDDAARLARASTSTPPRATQYHFLFVAKGGGSANKTFLFQQTKALLNEASLLAFVEEKIKGLGTAACPPYHLALVVGGLSAEMTLKTVKLASTKYLDGLPRSGDANGRAFRDEAWEAKVRGKVTRGGVFLEALERTPRFLPEASVDGDGGLSEAVVAVDLERPMDDIRAQLSRGAARRREPMPQYLRDRIVYYAGPAKTPDGHASGSFARRRRARMDSYVGPFMEAGGSFVSLAKGNRSKQNCIRRNVEVLEYPELGMEAVWKIDVENFPAFIVVNDKGDDFFKSEIREYGRDVLLGVPLVLALYPLTQSLAAAAAARGASERVFWAAATSASHTVAYVLTALPFVLCDAKGWLQRYKVPRPSHQRSLDDTMRRLWREALLGHVVTTPAFAYAMFPLAVKFGMPPVFGHHAYVASIAPAAEFSHPLENVLSNVIPSIGGVFFFGRPGIALWVWLFLRLQQTYETHSGYSFADTWVDALWLTHADGAAEHDHHHAVNKGCFGAAWLDWTFGTMDAFVACGGAAGYRRNGGAIEVVGKDGTKRAL
ncbi:fumarase [Aureococcus anophagefferens]|uniref:Fumarase n=1 Tax=Aureococcus anophagefferens TaxID=44056 RepID=A0ABR1FH68_AURAN